MALHEQHLLTFEIIPTVTQIELVPEEENSPTETTVAHSPSGLI